MSLPPETPTAVFLGIGGKGHLDDATLRKMQDAPRMVHAAHPNAEITLFIDGYDNDPRELWQIEEVVQYIRRFARASGLHDWKGELFLVLDSVSKGLLIACDAIDKPHPYKVELP